MKLGSSLFSISAKMETTCSEFVVGWICLIPFTLFVSNVNISFCKLLFSWTVRYADLTKGSGKGQTVFINAGII